MVMFSAVNCSEEHSSQSEQWGESVDCTATLRCSWASRHTLVADILGSARAWPYGGFASPPRAKNASIVPAPTTYAQYGQGFVYTDALVTIGYSSDVEEDLISESIEPMAEFITLDYKRFRWGSSAGEPLTEGEAPGKLVRTLKLVRTHYKVTSIPAAVLTLPGAVNDADYVSALLGLTFKVECLLFGPPTLSRTITTAGIKAWDATFTYIYRPSNWNMFWRAKTQLYERIFHVYGGQYDMYPKMDFSALLY